ncbi:MAG: aminotransferase class I/II-fold pyridoxal phosphate-dependent enzyme [Syntrophomonadaceae bacterium]|jgi:lysine decarboxylase|nr:aminotransferase class I/II-fold pyridoxal phosphate-dependent enzyme [Syntrophomonadaceae bacterium]
MKQREYGKSARHQLKAPIYNTLVKYIQENRLRLHMPGHAGGRGMPKVFQDMASYDFTELPELDNFHLPRSIIKRAAKLLAETAGAQKSFFLINGATSGIQAFFLSLRNMQGKVLLPRNAHQAFFSGLVLSGAEPVYIPAQTDEDTGVAWGVNRQDIAEALEKHADLEAVFLVSPNYYGTCLNVRSIARMTENHDAVPLIIDEAHGGHFVFHPQYPEPALQQGADAVVQGLHKTWPVFNQGACLHTGRLYKRDKQLGQAVGLVSSSSPSYPLLASMDYARAFLSENGEGLLEQALKSSQCYKEKINRLPGFKLVQEEWEKHEEITGTDPLKILIKMENLSLDGFQVGRILREEFKIEVELQSVNVILAMMSMFHESQEWQKLYEALEKISLRYLGARKRIRVPAPPMPKQVVNPRSAWLHTKTLVDLRNSRGCVAGELIAAYPPGIPCMVPGELINEEIIEYLLWLRANCLQVHKAGGESGGKIWVLDGAI